MARHKEKVPKEHPYQWHPANYAGLQIELAEEKDFLSFGQQSLITPFEKLKIEFIT